MIVSCGFDAGMGDPLGGYQVTPAGYAHMTHLLMGMAQGKVVVALEGGMHDMGGGGGGRGVNLIFVSAGTAM